MRIKSQFLVLSVVAGALLSGVQAQTSSKALEVRRAEPMVITAKRLQTAEQVRLAEPMQVVARASRQGLAVAVEAAAVEAAPAITRNGKRLPS